MINNKHNKIFIGVAWPYVNGDLHIGHYAGYLLPSDISARYHRLRGRDVLMVSGSDCFGTPTTVEADKRSKTPREIVEEYHAKDEALFKLLGISYDLYTRTDNPVHVKTTQSLFLALLRKGFIFKDTSEQYYSTYDKKFLPDRYVEGICSKCDREGARGDQCDFCGNLLDPGDLINPISKNSKSPVILKKTEHYFIDWPKIQPFLEKYVNSTNGWRHWVLAETKGWLKTGLKPRAITRDIDWGVEIPVELIPEDQRLDNSENKRFYVWFDAVIGYLSASIEWSNITGKDWKPFWYDDTSYHYYFMGKDNLIFHTLFWPGQIHNFDEYMHLPDQPAINQFLNLEGQKFSKSRGVHIDTKHIVEKFGNDIVRFYLTLIMPENDDTNFSWEDFYQKVNTVLIANLGNYINRVLTLSQGIDFGRFNEEDLHLSLPNQGLTVSQRVNKAFSNSYDLLDACKFKDYLNEVLDLSSYGNILMSAEEPWKLKEKSQEGFELVMFNLCYIVYALNYLITPLLPETSKKLSDLLGIENPQLLSDLDRLEKNICAILTNSHIKETTPLFTKIEKSSVQEEKSKLSKK